MRSLVVLGGADGAITTLQAARRLGLHAICVDMRTDAPAIRWADEFCNVSTRDGERLVAQLRDRTDIVGVLSPASDVNLPAQHLVAQRLGLPCGLSAAALQASVDKGFFRDVCDRLGQPGPRFAQGTAEHVRTIAAALTFPLIVKPTDSSGGRGISVCSGPDGLAAAVAMADGFSPSGVVIAEEYVVGSHHTAEAIVVDGRVALLGVGDRELTALPHFVTVQHTMPTRLPGLVDRVQAMLDDVCRELDYQWGSINVDVLVTPDDQVILVELGARLGGNGSAELLASIHGVDVIEASVRMAVGERPDLTPATQAHAAFRVISADRAGKMVAVHGADRVRGLPGVLDLVLAAQPGDQVEPYHRAGAKIGYVMASAPDDDQLQATLDRVASLLTIEVTAGPERA